MEEKRPCIGRQKIAIAKIPKKNHLQVTFSKRRAGAFKKASELSTLCGVEIAIIVFSPAGKAFSFGHPNVDSIIDRFLARNSPSDNSVCHRFIEAHRNANIRVLNMQLTQILNQLEVERKRGELLNEIQRTSQGQCWWEAPIHELGLRELEQLKIALEELKKNVANEVNKISLKSMHPALFDAVNVMDHVNVNPHEIKLEEINVASSSLPMYDFGYGHGHEFP